MQERHPQRVARAVGVSNFHPDRLVDLTANDEITPAANQIATHPFVQRTADQQLLREHGVQIESWGGFAEVKSSSATSRRGPTPDAAAAAQHRRLHRCRHLVRTRPGPVGPIGKRLQPADLIAAQPRMHRLPRHTHCWATEHTGCPSAITASTAR
jgi:hypothetical protein